VYFLPRALNSLVAGLRAGRFSASTEMYLRPLTGDRSALEPHLARRPDRDERGGLRVALGQILDERVVPLSLVLVCGDQAGAVGGDLECVTTLGVGGLALHDDDAVAELHEVLPGIATHIGFLDAVRERALAADGEATGGRSGRPREHAGRQHQQVVRADRIARRVALFEEDPR